MNNNVKKPTPVEQLSDAAPYVLPYLLPAELSAVASTCKTLHLFAKSVTAARSSDACRNSEKLPVPFVNSAVDNHPYVYFIYTPTQVLSLPDDPLRQPWSSSFDGRPDVNLVLPPIVEDGCRCECERCDGETVVCPCSRMKVPGLKWECGSGCMCGLECGNRVCQRGLSIRLKIVRSRKKGWGLHADQFIRGGEFICEYAGNLFVKMFV